MRMTIKMKIAKERMLSFLRFFSDIWDSLIFFVEKYSKYVDKKKKKPPTSTES